MDKSIAKPPRDWVEEDIAALITNQVKESIDLDYKASGSLQRSDGKKNEISKDVSAFANSAGGVLIYGVKEKNRFPDVIDDGFDPEDISREWLESVINSTIKPRIDGIVINQVELSKTSPGRVLYVVEIPQTRAGGPHQASDNRYYKRFNFESRPMEDYEVRDVMRRALGPDLYCVLRVGTTVSLDDMPTGSLFTLSLRLSNRSPEPALYAHIDLYISDELEVQPTKTNTPSSWGTARCALNGRTEYLDLYRHDWITPQNPPVWRGVEQEIWGEPLVVKRTTNELEFPMVISINAPHMSQVISVFDLSPFKLGPHERVVRRGEIDFSAEEPYSETLAMKIRRGGRRRRSTD